MSGRGFGDFFSNCTTGHTTVFLEQASPVKNHKLLLTYVDGEMSDQICTLPDPIGSSGSFQFPQIFIYICVDLFTPHNLPS